jgi:hypothetical protein
MIAARRGRYTRGGRLSRGPSCVPAQEIGLMASYAFPDLDHDFRPAARAVKVQR